MRILTDTLHEILHHFDLLLARQAMAYDTQVQPLDSDTLVDKFIRLLKEIYAFPFNQCFSQGRPLCLEIKLLSNYYFPDRSILQFQQQFFSPDARC